MQRETGHFNNKNVIDRKMKLESIEEINCLQELGNSYIIIPIIAIYLRRIWPLIWLFFQLSAAFS